MYNIRALQSGPVVQLVRTLACHARGRGFEPHPGRHFFAVIAQSVERILGKDEVGGSNPPNSSKKTPVTATVTGFLVFYPNSVFCDLVSQKCHNCVTAYLKLWKA